MRGGKRPNAGRKPGGANKKTREIADKATQDGITPLEVMLNHMRELWQAGNKAEAATIAKDAAPYMHPRLANIESKVDATVESFAVSGDPLTDEEWATEYSVASATGAAEGAN